MADIAERSDEWRMGWIAAKLESLEQGQGRMALELTQHQVREEALWRLYEERMEGLTVQINSLKLWRAWILGASATVALFVTALGRLVTYLFSK